MNLYDFFITFSFNSFKVFVKSDFYHILSFEFPCIFYLKIIPFKVFLKTLDLIFLTFKKFLNDFGIKKMIKIIHQVEVKINFKDY